MTLIHRCAALRPGDLSTIEATTKYTLRAIARRWRQLHEITGHERLLRELTDRIAPQLTAAIGIGPDIAADLLIVAGDNADRIPREAAFAKLFGACRSRPPAARPNVIASTVAGTAKPLRAHRAHALPRTHQGLRRQTDRRRQNQARNIRCLNARRTRSLDTPTPTPQPNNPPNNGLTSIGASTRRVRRSVLARVLSSPAPGVTTRRIVADRWDVYQGRGSFIGCKVSEISAEIEHVLVETRTAFLTEIRASWCGSPVLKESDCVIPFSARTAAKPLGRLRSACRRRDEIGAAIRKM